MTRGRFITFEGGEGGGKSTQIGLLADKLSQTGLDVVCTREPGGSPGAEEIRALLVDGDPGRWDGLSEALLFFAARRDHLVRTIWPALDRGAWVLSDRFADSTRAYQAAGHGVDSDAIETLYRVTIGDFVPDLTLVLDLPPELGIARARGRDTGEDRYERMDIAFHHRLRQAFLDLAIADEDRFALIDASRDLQAVEGAITQTLRDRWVIEL